jgi:DNA polymerase-3 subunit alpha
MKIKLKRINVRKIASLKDLFNSSISEITLNLSSKSQLKEIQNFLDEKGDTVVNISISDNSTSSVFKLKTTRNFDRKTINILRNKDIILNIH